MQNIYRRHTERCEKRDIETLKPGEHTNAAVYDFPSSVLALAFLQKANPQTPFTVTYSRKPDEPNEDVIGDVLAERYAAKLLICLNDGREVHATWIVREVEAEQA